jgi:hypothetical protein
MSQRQRWLLGVLVVGLMMGPLLMPLLAGETKGKIASVNPEKNQFVITENFKNWTFQLDRDGKVMLNGRESKLEDLQAGDEALVSFTRRGEQLLADLVRCMRK